VQTGLQYARDHGFDVAVQVDADAQHDPTEIVRLLEPIADGRADLVVGSRFLGERQYHPPFTRLVGIKLFAALVSLIVGQRVTDTTSGFRAVNRRAILLFAADYPHDYPEVEATVLVSKHRLRLTEVPVRMRTRTTGASSITFRMSVYYMIKVMLALFVGLFRRSPTPLEDK
jgi:glycosyltransferase involved in cell wall biosynthesis